VKRRACSGLIDVELGGVTSGSAARPVRRFIVAVTHAQKGRVVEGGVRKIASTGRSTFAGVQKRVA
jgi:hypothetical protein